MFGQTAFRTTLVVGGKTVRSMAVGLYLGFATLGLAGIASSAYADPITVPTGLNPGAQYWLVFATRDSQFQATSADIEVYNTFVSDVVAAVPLLDALGATWKAIAST